MADEDDMEEDGYDGLEFVHDDSDPSDNSDDFEERFDSVSDKDDDEDEGSGSGEKVNFDMSLPSSHTYLGEEMDDVGGRTVMEEDNIVSIPLLSFPNLLLVPGQTLPLHLFQPQNSRLLQLGFIVMMYCSSYLCNMKWERIVRRCLAKTVQVPGYNSVALTAKLLVAMMKNLLEKDKTFGVVTYDQSMRQNTDEQPNHFTGTTCEIFSVKEETESGISSIRVKAMARKRFQVVSSRRQIDGNRIGLVRILPDVLVPAYPSGALPQCVRLSRAITCPVRAMERLAHTSRKQVYPSSSAWPVWVYELYNPYLLMEQIKLELRSWNENLKTDTLSTEPTEFSYWVTHNLPLDDQLRNQLLKLDCPIQRLRRQLEIIQKYGIMICQDCATTIADKKDLFCMSLGGPMGAYVNPGGFIHETVTFYKAKGLRLRGSRSTQHSWFPGYAWTIAECKHCRNHMGWKFTAENKNLVPAKFWGLTRASLRPSLKQNDEDDL